MSDESNRFYALCHPGGPKAALSTKPEFKRQDDVAAELDLYVVVLFPRLSGIGPARLYSHAVQGRLAQTPEAAITKFLDGLAPGKTWQSCHDAGHRVRKVRLTDLGDAETGNTLSVDAPTLEDVPAS